MAAEKAGVYIESYSKTKNFKLVEDEIVALANLILQGTIKEERCLHIVLLHIMGMLWS